MKTLDLFCGAGGFSSGFIRRFGGTHLAIDIDSWALETYRYNHPYAMTLQLDISTLHSNEVVRLLGGPPDIIIASPPCEEFSRANPLSDLPATERIYGDGTAHLLLDAIRLIGDLEPAVFVIENVAALTALGGSEIVQNEFERVGIDDVRFNLVRAHLHGNPSQRLRLFISNIDLRLPRTRPPCVMDTIGDLPSLGFEDLLDPRDPIPNHHVPYVSPDKLKKIKKLPWGKGIKQFTGSRGRTLPNWVRLYPDRVATSIIGSGRYIHPYEHRILTVREHARLMSYPDHYVFQGPTDSQYDQVGESVPPLISSLIAEEVAKKIE